jgi:uncharacterized protein (DUF433 family)
LDATFWKDCPDVEVDPEKMGGRPTVGPFRLTAETVMECEELGARQPQLTPSCA